MIAKSLVQIPNRISLDLDWDNQTEALSTLRHFIKLQEQADKKDADVEEDTLDAPARDGYLMSLKVFRPAPKSSAPEQAGSPLIVLYFGGGYVVGSPTTMARTARSLVKRLNAVVVAPTYRLAPEWPFPTGINDGWDSIKWIASNAIGALRADPRKGFVVGGISAGGNITNVVTHLARDHGLAHQITGNWLSCPGVRLRASEKLPPKYAERNLSREQQECINSPILPPGFRKLMTDSVKPDEDSELHAPLLWPTGHKDMPKTYSQVCGMDTGRDELLIYDDMLKHEGVKTRLDLYPGLPHVFWGLYKELPQSKQWEEDTIKGFAWLLERSED